MEPRRLNLGTGAMELGPFFACNFKAQSPSQPASPCFGLACVAPVFNPPYFDFNVLLTLTRITPMALAVRRYILRSNCSSCSLRSPPISSQLRCRRIHSIAQRCFHRSSSIRKDDAPANASSQAVSLPTTRRSKHSKASPQSRKPNQNPDEATMHERLVEKLAETGDVEGTFRKFGLDPNSLSAQERKSVNQLVAQVADISRRDSKLDQLAEAMELNVDNPDGMEEVVRRLGIDSHELMAPPSEEERGILAEQGVNPNDAYALERAALKSMAQDGQKSPYRIEDITDDIEALPNLPNRELPGFWNDDKSEDLGPDEEFNQDELPTSGHIELDLHREIREYARLMVWELPLLSSKCLHLHLMRKSNPEQNSDVPTTLLLPTNPSVSATRPTWAKTIRPNPKSSSPSRPRTCLSTLTPSNAPSSSSWLASDTTLPQTQSRCPATHSRRPHRISATWGIR